MSGKKILALSITAILALSGISASAKIIRNPSFNARTSSVLTVEEIDLGKKETRMKFRAVFRPNWWICVDSTKYILDPATGEKYYPTAIEGIKFGEKVVMPQSADTVFTLIFPPLPKKVKTIDLFPESSWKTFGLSLSGKKPSRKETPADTPVAGQRIPSPSFFTEGDMHIYGKIKGYDRRLGFDALKIYIEDLPLGNSMSKMIPVDSCGRFDYQLFVTHPQSTFLNINSITYLPIYVEPGNDLQIILDMEDILDIDRMRGLKNDLENVDYGGSLAEINRAILKAPQFTGTRAQLLADNTAPLEAKENISRSIADLKERTEKYIEGNNFTSHTRDYLMSCVQAEEFGQIFDYDFYRIMNQYAHPDSAFFTSPIPQEYYAEIGRAALTADTTILATPPASLLLNRMAYSSLPQTLGIKNRYSQDTPETAQAISRFCNSREVPFMWQITVAASNGKQIYSDAKWQKDYFRQMLDNLYAGIISSPYLRQRLDDTLEEQANAVAAELPDTPGGELMRRLIKPYAGKWILVDFWATTCGPCRANIEHEKDFRDLNRDNDQFTFLFLTGENESPLSAYNAYVAKHLSDDHTVYLSTSELLYLQDLFGINAIPHYVLIDPQGRVYDKHFDNFTFARILENEGITVKYMQAPANFIIKNQDE